MSHLIENEPALDMIMTNIEQPKRYSSCTFFFMGGVKAPMGNLPWPHIKSL